jgi:hypothetical protein
MVVRAKQKKTPCMFFSQNNSWFWAATRLILYKTKFACLSLVESGVENEDLKVESQL